MVETTENTNNIKNNGSSDNIPAPDIRHDARQWSRYLAGIPEADRLPSIHPGEILEQEYLIPGHITKYRLATDAGMTASHVGQIIAGTRSITAPVALRLAAYFGTSPQIWMNLQAAYDLEVNAREMAGELNAIPPAPLVTSGTTAAGEGEDASTGGKRLYVKRKPPKASSSVKAG